MDSGFHREAVLFTEDGDGAMLDELVRPANANNRGLDALVGKVVDDGAAEAIVQDMVLHSAEDIASRREKLDGRVIEGFDPSSIDDRCRDPEFFEFGGGGEGEFAHVAEGDDRCAGAVAED